MPLIPTKIYYQTIRWETNTSKSGETYGEKLNEYPLRIWVVDHPLPHDFLDNDLCTNEKITEVMSNSNHPWGKMHHHTSFLPKLDKLNESPKILDASNFDDWCQSPIMLHDVFSKGNLENISKIVAIKIIMKSGVVENIMIGADCTP